MEDEPFVSISRFQFSFKKKKLSNLILFIKGVKLLAISIN